MKFENNKINTTIWSYLNKFQKQIKDNSKPIITFDIPFEGVDMPYTMYDDYLIDRLFDVAVNENTRMEFLKKVIDRLEEKEKLALKIYIEQIPIDTDKLSDFDKMQYHNKINKKNHVKI